jgi:predicted secreted Zn-dependent protease
MAVAFQETEWRWYDVDGDTLAAAASAFSDKPEAATTEWFPRYSYSMTGARLTSVDVTVAIRVTMPRWVGFEAAPHSEQIEWGRFCRALRAHEIGHIALVHDHLDHVDRRMVGRAPDAAKRAWEAALSVLAEASDRYDGETDHGRRAGTMIDVAVADVTEV